MTTPADGYDHHSPAFAESWPDQYRRLRSRCPVAHSDSHGGFYVLTRYDDVRRAATEYSTFSSEHDAHRGGIMIPPNPTRLGMIEMDPPLQLKYRKILTPWLTPKAVRAYEPRIRELVDDRIDGFIEAGRFDVVEELANPVPAILTLDLMGLPLDDWERFALPLHRMVYVEQDSPGFSDVLADLGWIQQRLGEAVADRKAHPRDDLVTAIACGAIDGEPLPTETAVEMLFMLLTGGVETSAALIAGGLLYLAQHPGDRRRLIDDPAMITSATDEFIRYLTPSTGVARTVVAETELSGVTLTPGTRVWLAWGSAARDPAFVDDPETIQIDRKPGAHPNFGFGTHRCLGSHLAHADMRIVLEQVLSRLPDYRIDPDSVRRFPSIGIINGYLTMPATFTPGVRRDRKESK